jgi:predicted permease
MFKSYFKVALRNLYRQRVFSIINILGLGLGLACSLLIGLWVRDEFQVDAFHKNGSQLYQIRTVFFFDGNKKESNPGTQGKLYEELPKKIPEVTYASGFYGQETLTLTVGDRFNKEMGGYAGPDWFRMFSFPLIEGSPQTVLQNPTSIVISRKIARKYFGDAWSAVGKTIRVENKTDYQVSGVFEDITDQSSLKFDFLLTWEVLRKQNEWLEDWGNSGPPTFVQLRADADPARVNAKIKHFLQAYIPDTKTQLTSQPFEDIYLYSNFKNGVQDGGRIEYVRLFSIVAVFILLIACINFMNLATARSVKRAKEVGVRKVVGAVRSLLIGQFLGEAMLLTILSVLTAMGILSLLLPTFNQLTGKHIELPFAQPAFLLALGGLTLVTGVVSGSYPALFLSSLNPVRVLKGTLKFKPEARFLRQGLVVLQFVLSILLIVGMIVVYQQLEYIQHKNLGYDRESLVHMPIEGELKFPTFRDELLKMPGVRRVSRIATPPTGLGGITWGVEWPGKDPNVIIFFAQNSIGYDFVKTMNVKLLDGREFSRAFATDTAAYLINQTAAKAMGLKDPVGQTITFWGKKGPIVGLIQDFHFESLHEAIKPLILRLEEAVPYGLVLVRTEPGKTREALDSMEKLSKQLNPKVPFTYAFTDDDYGKLYQSEQVVGKLVRYFAFLGIFISCLGLLGLAAFTAEQRTKEIGIRKVLGASVSNIVSLLSKDFIKLVLLANVIAWPLAWWAASSWLSNFTYRAPMAWWIFAAAGLAALLIALLTVSYQALKAALANPVKSLRTE